MRTYHSLKWGLLVPAIPLTLTACGQNLTDTGAALAAAKPDVYVSTIQMEEISPVTNFIARTKAVDDVLIRPRVGGYIVDRSFTEGDQVKKGQVLFTVDPKPYQIAVKQAEASLKQARTEAAIAEKLYQRGATLLKKNAISELEVVELQAEMELTKAAVMGAEAVLDQAELDLGFTKVKAPMDGRIADAKVSVGDLVAPGQDLTSVVSTDPIQVVMKINEKRHINRLQAALQEDKNIELPAVNLELANGTLYGHEGEIEFFDNRVDSASGTMRVRLSFPNPDELLVPGQLVTVKSKPEQAEPALFVPEIAVQEDQRGRFLMVVNQDNMVEPRYVEMGFRLDKKWKVESGLEAGERVIVRGLSRARAGAEVNAHEAN